MAPSSDLQSFRKVLATSKCIVILAGAGLSAGSGIPTFRGAGGWWRKYQHLRPSKTIQAVFGNSIMNDEKTLARPNVISRIAPSLDDKFPLPLFVTQNVDGLSMRALASLPPDLRVIGEKNLLQMHGSIFVTRCTNCEHEQPNFDLPLCTALGQHRLDEDDDIPISELPKCGGEKWNGSDEDGNCGGLLRPAVVWFGEMPDYMEEIDDRLKICDLILVVGTSSTVAPASTFADTVQDRRGKVAVFNLERSNGDEDADFLFLGPCADTLPDALGITAEDLATH
ncbi:hypothetical protein FRB96_001070 [Tulasnella sp. 330]|nr:hypothetical protein FRB96_001070 [Tulasnella sp. 330]KAG8873654.1 hypothetical protein FRB97_006559 [Tulasnella sp. 331]